MSHPPKLSTYQKKRLRRLEPELRKATHLGDLNKAKRITKEIQDLLRPTNHETRLMKAKNWLYETAIEAGQFSYAQRGLIGNRKKTNPNTRVHLEATALLAISHLRLNEISEAETYMREVLQNDKVIKSDKRRREFRRKVIKRFEEEVALATLKDSELNENLNTIEIENLAGELQAIKTEDEIYRKLGALTPFTTRNALLKIDEFTRNQLPPSEIKYLLPSPEKKKQDDVVGRIIFNGIKHRIWKAICDPNSNIYKVWKEKSVSIFCDKGYIATAVVAVLTDIGIGCAAISIPVIALLIRYGLDVYCTKYKPEGILVDNR